MIRNGADLCDNSLLQSQVCVIGAGAAGITLGLELAQRGIDVILLEAGDSKARAFPDADLDGHIIQASHHAPLHECRSRQLGGTTALWAGRCLPFDPIDFEPRDYVQHSGWPISFEEIERYYPLANDYCFAGEYSYDAAQAFPGAGTALIPGFSSDRLTCTRLERWSLPTHFGKHYRKQLTSSRCLCVLLNSVCVEITLDPHQERVDSVIVATAPGRHFRVKAKAFVLAGGGLETTRLLLASNKICPEGIGNRSGHLGRYYMGHLFGSIANIQISGDPHKTLYDFERDRQGVYCRRRFWVTPETQKQEKLLNTAIWLTNPPAANPDHRSGILSAAYLALGLPYLRSKLAPPAIQKAFRGAHPNQSVWPHLRNMVFDLPHTVFFSSQFLFRRFIPKRKIPALFIFNRSNGYDLYYHAEQTPRWRNRVSLQDCHDRLGIPRLQVDFDYSPQDIDSVVRTHQILADQLQRDRKWATLRFKENDSHRLISDQARDGFHQIGTTRMSVREKDGVVDPNCRVHGIDNLYVCSSSVFPTSGQANPTLTIVALAIRMARHLILERHWR